MTVVGKILVFLNLIFSLAVGAFAVLSYTADTHWRKGYTEMQAQYQVAKTASLTYKAEADALAAERKRFNEKLVGVAGKDLEVKDARNDREVAEAAGKAAALLDTRRQTIDRMKGELDDLRTKLGEERKKNSKYEVVATEAQENVKRRQVDAEKLRLLVKEETDKNIDLVREYNKMRDRAVSAEIQEKSVKDINARLEGQLQEMARDMARMRSTVGSAGARLASGTNPPPESVEGLVSRADGNLVSLTIGSDAGLALGHTLQVFRLGQNPRYIGQVRLIDVKPGYSVGQIMGRVTAPIQKGDTVASRIMGGN